jgi:hypothetical protein
MTSHELVERIHEPTRPNGAQDPRERAGQTDLGEERHAPSCIPWNRSAVAENDPPTVVPGLFGYRREQAVGFCLLEREERQLFVPVEPGDDPRRPAAELSAPGIEQNRARKGDGRRHVRVGSVCHG